MSTLVEKGIPLERLEKRLRPELGLKDWHAEEEAHDGFSSYSRRGFLGVDEHLLDVIHEDWQTIEHYGVSHQQIAEALYPVIRQKVNLSSHFEFYP